MKVKIQRISDKSILPSYNHKGDAGLDFYSIEDIVLLPGDRNSVSTGIKLEIPNGYVGLFWDKSGLAKNNGLKTMAGVIDSGYRGEVKIVLINLGKEKLEVKKGSKIAQMLIQKVEEVDVEESDNLSVADRGDKGFGSRV